MVKKSRWVRYVEANLLENYELSTMQTIDKGKHSGH